MDQRLAKTNFEYCNETAKLKSEIEHRFLELGERLYRIWKEKKYEPNFESFVDYLEDIKIGRATANKLINIYFTFIVQFKFKPALLVEAGGWSSISEVVQFATTKTKAKMWLDRVQSNTRADLRKFITEEKTGVDMAECKHKETYTIEICKRCGNRMLKHEPDSNK